MRSRASEVLLLLAAAALLGRAGLAVSEAAPAPPATPRPYHSPPPRSAEVAQLAQVLTPSRPLATSDPRRLSWHEPKRRGCAQPTSDQIRQMLDDSRSCGGPWLHPAGAGMRVHFRSRDNVFGHLGLRSGDILTKLNGHGLRGPEDVSWMLGQLRNSNNLTFVYLRNGKHLQKVIDFSE